MIKEFKVKHRSDFMLLIEHFETKKRLIKPGDDTKLCFQIPQSLKTSSEKLWGYSLEEHFIKMNISGVQVKKRGKVFIMSSFLLYNFFYLLLKRCLKNCSLFSQNMKISTVCWPLEVWLSLLHLSQRSGSTSETYLCMFRLIRL